MENPVITSLCMIAFPLIDKLLKNTFLRVFVTPLLHLLLKCVLNITRYFVITLFNLL